MKDYAFAILTSLLFASLLIFVLVVSEVYPADITLNWKAPTTNIDNTKLDDLSGYNVYHDGVPEDVGNVLTHTVNNVLEGNCFTVTAFDISGNESFPSNKVCVGIPPAAPVMGCSTSICNQCVINNCQNQ